LSPRTDSAGDSCVECGGRCGHPRRRAILRWVWLSVDHARLRDHAGDWAGRRTRLSHHATKLRGVPGPAEALVAGDSLICRCILFRFWRASMAGRAPLPRCVPTRGGSFKAGGRCFPASTSKTKLPKRLKLSLQRPDAGLSITCATHDPRRLRIVIAHAAELLGLRRAPAIPFEEADHDPRPDGRSF